MSSGYQTVPCAKTGAAKGAAKQELYPFTTNGTSGSISGITYCRLGHCWHGKCGLGGGTVSRI